MTPVGPPPLLALSPGNLLPGGERGAASAFAEAARSALGAGLRGILLREPALPDGELLALARRLAGLLDVSGGWLGVHDRVHLASACGAHGVHVGFRSLPVPDARRVVGDAVALGFSSHAGDAPEAWGDADYVFHGPVHDTPSKAGRLAPVGVAELADFVAGAPPVWALGGIGVEDCEPVLRTGARGVAVLGGIFGSQDPARQAARYVAAVDTATGGAA
ncbi:MAG: thiamine phosphate synthase [bacterium]|nr:thiamine phosphate synthase [bacterium]